MNVEKLAHLARVKLDANEIKEFESKFNLVIEMINSALNEVKDDLSDITPMTSCNEQAFNNMRDDIEHKTDIDDVFLNSNEKSKNFKCFIVPKVI
jgi:aspartyl/glutamyl-tRNA(Asn/Gln) amidotransferase C subunit